MYDYDSILERQRKRIALIPANMFNDLEEYYRDKDNLKVVEIHPTAPSPAVFEEIEKYKDSFVVLRSAPGMKDALLASGYEFVLAGWVPTTSPDHYKEEMIAWRDTQSDRISKVFVGFGSRLGYALAALDTFKAL